VGAFSQKPSTAAAAVAAQPHRCTQGHTQQWRTQVATSKIAKTAKNYIMLCNFKPAYVAKHMLANPMQGATKMSSNPVKTCVVERQA